MNKRKAISKKNRFEVFKRDSFTCQYCGKMPPDAILHVDHIKPVAKGGTNNILNLVTSCSDCNLGKSDRKLDDDAVLSKQKQQLRKLGEKRDQMRMMIEWREEVENQRDELSEFIRGKIDAAIYPRTIKDFALKKYVRAVSKYGFNEVCDAIDVSEERFIRTDDDGEIIEKTCDSFLSNIIPVCNSSKKIKSKPYLEKLYYIRGICRNRFNYCVEWECMEILEHAYSCGVCIEEMTSLAKKANHWTDWKDSMEELKCLAQEI